MSRASAMTMTRRIEDFLIVTIVTLLLFFYAESQTLVSHQPGPMELQIRPASPGLVVVDQSVERVTVEFRGTQNAVSRLRTDLTEGLMTKIETTTPGQHTLSIADLLLTDDNVAEANISIERVEPQFVDVTLARLVTRDVQLIFEAPTDVQLQDNSYRIVPPSARIEMREDLLPQLRIVDDQIVIPVRIATDLRTMRANVPQTIRGARLDIPPALEGHIKILSPPPDSIVLSFTIEKKATTHTLPDPVGVYLTLPPDEWSAFNVHFNEEDQLIHDVKVTGPRELVEQIKRKEAAIFASVLLTRDDLLNSADKDEKLFPVRFASPEGVTVESPKNNARVRVVRVR